MSLYTILSDFGVRDPYVGALKGNLLKLDPDAVSIDISHNFSHLETQYAAFVARECFPHFPKKTVHILAIDTLYQESPDLLCCYFQEQYFIAPDHGFLPLMLGTENITFYKVQLFEGEKVRLHYIYLYARIAAALAKGTSIKSIATPIDDYRSKFSNAAFAKHDKMTGQVIYIDAVGNVITNIEKDFFEYNLKGRKYTIIDRSSERTTQLNTTYRQSTSGNKVVFFNSHNLLQISIVDGSASKLLNLKYGDNILIQFHDS